VKGNKNPKNTACCLNYSISIEWKRVLRLITTSEKVQFLNTSSFTFAFGNNI